MKKIFSLILTFIVVSCCFCFLCSCNMSSPNEDNPRNSEIYLANIVTNQDGCKLIFNFEYIEKKVFYISDITESTYFDDNPTKYATYTTLYIDGLPRSWTPDYYSNRFITPNTSLSVYLYARNIEELKTHETITIQIKLCEQRDNAGNAVDYTIIASKTFSISSILEQIKD